VWLAGCAAPQVVPPPEHLEKGVVFIKRLRAGRVIGTASGVIVSADGKMATSRHVVFNGDADVLLARTWDRKEHIVLGVLAVHTTVDLALLQLEPADYSPVRLAADPAIRPGEPIRVVGHPHGGPLRITSGTVQTVVDKSGLLDDFVQLRLNAAVAPGSSGSPVFNAQAEVIGIAAGHKRASEQDSVAWWVQPVARWLAAPNLKPVPLPLVPKPTDDDYALFEKEELRPWEAANRQGRHREARLLLEDVARRYQRSPGVRVLLAWELLFLHEPADAERRAREASRINPDSSAAWNVLGVALQALQRPVEADACARRALALNPHLKSPSKP